jgi:hypothetical protein
VLVQKLSRAYPFFETMALVSYYQKNPAGPLRCPAAYVWPLGCPSVIPTAQRTIKPLFTNTLLRGYKE